ncbi:MAG: TIGR02281 family clan AA aspartic protease [Gammaproteobacteria bacterium]|nr:TIGR02281 family clan AA aspartic protease [Gammaproteobacteria bacterium]MDH5659883.1 TIGR02281 family clan AA aspartic protease [Gammaproteobacteria bacterium]
MSSENREQKRLGHKFIIAMWIAVMIMVFFLFDNLLERDYNPNQQVNIQEAGQQRVVVLKRNRYGHYVTQGEINNHPVTFLIDTGASDISIPDKIARKLKLEYGQERKYKTANGVITGYLTTLNSVNIGNIELQNVRASINPKMKDDEILLGMSFMKYIEFTQRGDTLTLRQ